jgi:hypothetical protein
MRRIRELRKDVTLGPDLTIRDLIEEGGPFDVGDEQRGDGRDENRTRHPTEPTPLRVIAHSQPSAAERRRSAAGAAEPTS